MIEIDNSGGLHRFCEECGMRYLSLWVVFFLLTFLFLLLWDKGEAIWPRHFTGILRNVYGEEVCCEIF